MWLACTLWSWVNIDSPTSLNFSGSLQIRKAWCQCVAGQFSSVLACPSAFTHCEGFTSHHVFQGERKSNSAIWFPLIHETNSSTVAGIGSSSELTDGSQSTLSQNGNSSG